ncbi:DUF1223 domain-containing protein [Aquimarina agarivorans]|uniref:DUF1223 domain-containing protein n=1 Tax=Aquimarina agarivorans TaxID=980584 RepID=UPI000248EABB|nr:DUF1223 domain-containing protein [Aquimarina agarivorans]
MKKIICILFVAAGFVHTNAQEQANVVLELFTSQGCSSCPRADQLLKKIAESDQSDRIITLAYHVDYWDRLGWKDPFSKQEHTEYQYKYGKKFRGNSIYTPQLVINGDQHIVGSDVAALHASLNKINTIPLPLEIKLTNVQKETEKISVDYKVKHGVQTLVSFALVLKENLTSVKRGENRNRVLTNTHIVLDKKVISIGNHYSGTISFDTYPKYDFEDLEIVAYTQNNKLSVTGATKLALF